MAIKDEKIAPADGTIREAAIGKGLSGALEEEDDETDKKKRKLDTTSRGHAAKPKRLHDYHEENI